MIENALPESPAMENLIFNTILESCALHKIVPESCAMTVMAMLMMPLLMTTMAMAVQAVAAMVIGPGSDRRGRCSR